MVRFDRGCRYKSKYYYYLTFEIPLTYGTRRNAAQTIFPNDIFDFVLSNKDLNFPKNKRLCFSVLCEI